MKTKIFKLLSIIPIIATSPIVAACNKSGQNPEPVFPYEEHELPTCIINTENSQEIKSKVYYVNSTFSLKNCDETQKLTEVTGKIRGRGNLSWNWPKKSYSIKFDEKQSILGSKYKEKKWAIISNYGDHSLFRNYLAYTLASKLDKLIFSPSANFVDLYLNNKYLGVYLFVDRISVSKNRVAIDESIAEDGNNGYLLEQTTSNRVDGVENINYIRFSKDLVFELKSPDTEDEKYLPYAAIECNYIKTYIQSCFDALNSGVWTNVTEKMDVDTFVDGYIIEELFDNWDCYRYSMYYYKDKDGKLCHGPVWDFDLGAGNANNGPGSKDSCPPDKNLWAAENNIFYKGLYKYQEFKDKVSDRLDSFLPDLTQILELLNASNANSYYKKYKESIDRNFKKWDILGKNLTNISPIDVYTLKTIPEHHKFIKDWLLVRFNYMKTFYKK